MVDLIVFFLCFLHLSNNLVGADWGLSLKEELKFQKRLINLKKSAIKNIQTRDGDIYDCIDFYKQPGFDHPFWKNTTFEMKHNLFVEGMKAKRNLSLNFGLKGAGCPYGTVPIIRINKDDLTRAKMLSTIYSSNIDEEPGHHYAILRTKTDPNRKLVGIESYFSMYNTKGVTGSQYSEFRMTFSNGFDTIKTGLTIDGRTQCFNQHCPGYVQINSQIPLGWPIDNTSVVGGEQFAIKLRINKEIHGGPNSTKFAWTLYFDEDNSVIGFWPPALFGKLSEFGNQADWGGEVYSPLDQPSPPMGTGLHLYGKNSKYVAHSRKIAAVYENAKFHFVNPVDTEVYASNPRAYSIHDFGYYDEYWQRLIYYDGPGGIKGA
ncbi:protein neprosin-like [Alnus glutinosa]|uniref:protein neprosin-like n=1 Tax=Alnus glutinosa TaxID=3517 RepID=UPI002D792C05|nr:protein neprosin-like [Alnus glutinosa]